MASVVAAIVALCITHVGPGELLNTQIEPACRAWYAECYSCTNDLFKCMNVRGKDGPCDIYYPYGKARYECENMFRESGCRKFNGKFIWPKEKK